MNQDRIVATLIVGKDTGKLYALKEGYIPNLPGFPNELFIPITEAQLLTMNSFVRKRWEKAFQDIPNRDQYPLTPDQAF